jgi:DNA (cytosine-5)-methyltransferase 1
LDLFSGCGGLTWGFKSAGFPTLAAVDSDTRCVKTFTANYVAPRGVLKPFRCADVSQLYLDGPRHFLREHFSIAPPKDGVAVIGGPPCQAYSRVGRGKLGSLGKHRRHLVDPRARLYIEFLDIAFQTGAKLVVMENVLDSISFGGENIPDKICEDFHECGYNAGWSVLNAADFGVPQVRERVILVAVSEKTGLAPVWPKPTHYAPRASGILRQLIAKIRRESRFFHEPHGYDNADAPWVTVKDALSDLPSLRRAHDSSYHAHWLNSEVPYASAARNPYQERMRAATAEWDGTTAHVYRNTPRDFAIFDRMRPNDNFLAASQIADEMLRDEIERRGLDPLIDTNAVALLRKSIVPPYDRMKFDDKWMRLDPDFPSRTVVAHLGVDTYSHIHPWEPRGISVREAARLQSFPDDFHFTGSLSDAYSQIGNAVPPLLAFHVAKALASRLKKKESLHELAV